MLNFKEIRPNIFSSLFTLLGCGLQKNGAISDSLSVLQSILFLGFMLCFCTFTIIRYNGVRICLPCNVMNLHTYSVMMK